MMGDVCVCVCVCVGIGVYVLSVCRCCSKGGCTRCITTRNIHTHIPPQRTTHIVLFAPINSGSVFPRYRTKPLQHTQLQTPSCRSFRVAPVCLSNPQRAHLPTQTRVLWKHALRSTEQRSRTRQPSETQWPAPNGATPWESRYIAVDAQAWR